MALRITAAAVAALMLGSIASSASAALFDYTLTGTVNTLRDTTGTFGILTTGDPFTLVFHADTSLGELSAGMGGTGDGSTLFGGSSYIGTAAATMMPGIIVSPVSAMLFVNGHSMTLTGENLGKINVANGFLPGTAGFSNGELLARGATQVGSYIGSSIVDATFSSDHLLSLPLLPQPFSVFLNSPGVQSTVSLDRELTDPSTHQTIETIGSFNATRLVISPTAAVPEPASWALLLTGFGIVGGTLRSHRRSSTRA